MADITKAKEKIEKILVNWFTEDPMMLGTWCLVEKIADKTQKTMGIDSRTNPPVIRYNPNFVNALHAELLEAVMVSEGFKILLRHPTTRLIYPKHISNISSSITINQLLSSLSGFGDDVPLPDTFNLPRDKFFEEYFRNLIDKQTQTEDKIQQIWNSMSPDDKNELLDKVLNQNSNSNNGQNQEKSDNDGQNQNQQNGDKDSDGFHSFENQLDAMKQYNDPNGSSNKDWSHNNLFDADIKNFVDDNKGSYKKWGRHTGDAMSSIIAANTPKISWKEIVRRFRNSIIDRIRIPSRMKVNRRYDLLNPGHRRKYRSKLAFFVDVSGSMSDKILQEGFAVINKVCEHASITYGTFDTEIKDIQTNFRKAKEFKVTGRGGTDVNCVLEYAKQHKFDGVIIFSDMYFAAPVKPVGVKVLWLCSTKNQHPPVNWGYVAKLELYESHTW